MSGMSDVVRPETGQQARLAARAGFAGVTVGRAPGFVQANIYIVPAGYAADFTTFCERNPAACPLLGQGKPGDYTVSMLGRDLDIRTDLPAYHVHERGGTSRVTDISGLWKPDFVAFAVGCWLGAESALAAACIRMRHRELGLQGGLYRTDRPAVPSGALNGPLVVSMRPFRESDLGRVAQFTAAMPLSHGAPIHAGAADVLGIENLAIADWGDPVLPEAGEIPVFWPCGLTALAALQNAALPFFISHAPGSMLVTDLKEVFRP